MTGDSYIYSDEDNAPMNDDPFDGPHNPTVYTCRAEMEYVESGQWERDEADKAEAKRQRREDAIEGILDDLGLNGKCRKCDWIQDLVDGFMDDNDMMDNSLFEFLKTLCFICDHGKHLDRVEKEWDDRNAFVEGLNLPYICNWCHVPYEVYGQHKDPDDDWKDIENRCAKCLRFQDQEEPLPFTEKLTEMEKEREENENESI